MLLTVQEFLKRRPDMEVHMENAIQSAINSSFILLDGECAGLISQVQAYKESGENDTNNEYYRNDFEISQLIEALTSQTQYSLNLGNDYSIGGGSYSIGNINSSYNRPEGRDIVAPGVYKLLSNARVYNLNVGIGVKQNQDHYLEGIDPADKHISISKAQADFVSKYQPNAAVGNVAYVNESKMVSFSRPQDLQIGTYNTNRIAGGEGHRNNYYEIDSVPNIAFFGNNDRGTYSAIERGEVKQILNDNYLTKEQVFRVVYASGIVWNSRLNYERGWITQEVVNNVLYWYEALEDNTNKRPSQNPAIWKQLETQKIDLNAIFNQMKPYIDTEITDQVREQLLEAINNLPTIEYIEQNREQVLFFNSEQDFINFKNETGTTDRDYETLPFNATPTDYEEVRNKVNENATNVRDLRNQLMVVQNSSDRNSQTIESLETRVNRAEQSINNAVTTNTEQTITGNKTFNANVVISNNPTPLVLKANNNDKTYFLIKSSDNTTNFSLGANATDTSLEVNRGNLILKTLQSNKNVAFENVSEVKLNRSKIQLGTEINAGYGGGTVKFIPEDNSTKTLQFYNSGSSDTRRFNLLISEPTQANNPATKQYVDSSIANINSVSLTSRNIWSGENIFSDLTAVGTYGLKTDKITTAASDRTITISAGPQLGHLAVNTPTANNHTANKSYVDTQVNSLNSRVGQLEGSLGFQLRYQDLTITNFSSDTYGPFERLIFTITTLQETKFLSAVIHYKNQAQGDIKIRDWDLNYGTTWGPKIIFTLKAISGRPRPNLANMFIRIFYIDTLNSRTQDPYFVEEE